ncbi:phosphonate C-P lyase system protein PhnH [Sulfitobacter sp. S223]|uniref:phosphonate C-P lyase system protein PhnH n=1 Tax=Sulfitobacter sp. S223 TaxID=2867023 RepID=UPI0021A61B3B|nr:phosphonate C-P lyase system protein PhnH [Sulfitobacter sp. S223]UWR26601.1 phosphonate C-P lyase system protein PhnH [Sulfitobacter sp. S223]
MHTPILEGGFADKPVDAAHAFRAVMTAMARPGDILDVTGAQPPAPLSIAAGALILTLWDPETPVFLANSHNTAEIRNWITFHTGAPLVDPRDAAFAIGTWNTLPVASFSRGTSEYPDRSATLIIELNQLTNSGAVLRGPGIKDQAELSLPEADAFQENARLFPLGLDFIFTSGARLAALPRSTKVS